VDLRTSTLLIGKKRYQWSGQRRWVGLNNHHQGHQTPGASKSDLINPMTALPFGQAELPLLGSDSGGMDNGCWEVAASSQPLPSYAEGLVKLGKGKGGTLVISDLRMCWENPLF
jgi:hypothetical protein